MKTMERLKNIPYDNIKKGDVVKLENSDLFYVVFQHGQCYHLIPICMNDPDKIVVNIYDIHKPTIKGIYDGKNGNCKFIKEDEENEEN